MLLKKIELIGDNILLAPLSRRHLSGLAVAINDGELWKLTEIVIPHPDHLEKYLQDIETTFQRQGDELVFVIIDLSTRQVVGSTRFRAVNLDHKKAVIGPTFIARSWQRSYANSEAKYLMLKHAFEVWELNRVELLCDALNIKSRKAIRRLGAKEEGVIRQHRIMPDGRIRDTVLHSILQSEWLNVKQNMEDRMQRFSAMPYALSA